MQTVDTSGASQETSAITINLPSSVPVPVQDMHGNTLNVSATDTHTTVLPTDYMNILDIVLDNSKGNLQAGALGANSTLVLAEVDNTNGGMVAVSQTDGTAITLTPEQVTALTQAAARGETGLSIITPEEQHQTSNQDNDDVMIVESNNDVEASDIIKGDHVDDIEFEDDPNEVQQSTSTSVPAEKSGKASLRFKCDECARPYVTKGALKKHLQLIHNKELDISLQKATSKCIHPGCEKIFYHRQKMIDHLKEAHDVSCVQEDLVFNTWEEFLLWKEKEEDANFVHFSKNSTHTNAKNYMLTNFTCQREGKAGYKYKGGQQKKYKDLVIGEKICPARMRARLDKPTGRVTVQYCKSHNHKLSFQDFLYRRMPDRLRNEIREKLASGMTSEEVFKDLKSADNLRENRGERFAPSKRQFVTLVNIKTIAKRMNIKEPGISKNFCLEAEPLTIQIQKLLDESYNPVLLYKEQGSATEIGPNEIDQLAGSQELSLIAIQTKEQKEMFASHGHKIVFIDITEAVITPTQYVITLKVLDEYNKGYPIAFLISNSRDETVLFYFFREIQNRVQSDNGKVNVNAVMTENSCNEYYAFRSVFGEDVKHLLCKWNLHRAWCQKIHEECTGDESLQQELYFIFVTMLEEMDLTKFESIATEFVNNYQTRCTNFITFFMTNYLSQPEVWASCYRNNPLADCDEVLYADRIHERIKKEINNRKVKSLDDVLDMLLRFEHEDYFNRGLNLMLNPPEPHLIESEHELGIKIKNSAIVENYSADNRWLVKTTKRDPADLQNIKEETFIVTWKADICEKDFCRERCLKLACFGLCGHLYHCTCDGDPVTPCRHIHKVHSLRIGVSQYQTTEDTGNKETEVQLEGASLICSSVDTITSSSSKKKVEDSQKLNLVNQVSTYCDPNKAKNLKIKKIKHDLVKLYKFLESDNIQKYSLDFIETGLKNVLDECKVIDSIGQAKATAEVFKGKRKAPEKDLAEFEHLVKSVKRKKVMGTSIPVMVEIEPNPAIYNTFRKRITGSNEETPEDRMLKLTKSKPITINITSDEKYRRTQSQQVTSTPGIIVAKEGDDHPLIVGEGEELPGDFYQPDENDTEWTPRGQKKGKRGRPRKRPLAKTSMITMEEEHSNPSLSSVIDPTSPIITNGPHSLCMADIRALELDVNDEEKAKLSLLISSYFPGYLTNPIVNSYLHNLTLRSKVLFLTMEQMEALASNKPYTNRYWNVEDVSGLNKKRFVVGPWRKENRLVTFVIDLLNESIVYLDAANISAEDDILVKDLQSTLVGLMVVEIPFDNTRETPQTWTLSNVDKIVEVEQCDQSIRCLWYINQLCQGESLTDDTMTMETFRKVIYEDVAGHSIASVLQSS